MSKEERRNIDEAASPASAVQPLNVIGTDLRDIIKGTDGDDVIDGFGGDDIIYGRAGNDRLLGDYGNDQIYGGSGGDKIVGGHGNDGLYGGKDDDIIHGGDGNDWIVGGSGNDEMYGGADADLFWFDSDAVGEADIIRDFQDGIDLISFHSHPIGPDSLSFADLGIVDVAGGSLVEYGKSSIFVVGVAAADLTAQDFWF